MGVLVYNGLQSIDYQVVVEHPPVFGMPERDYEKVHVPGRNGDVIIDNGSYKNIAGKYDICFGSYFKFFPEMVYSVSRWLHSAQGQYARLEDSYDPEHFRYAAYLEENEFENIMFRAGRATVEFDCKPQRFLKSGDKPIEYAHPSDSLTVYQKSMIFKNPTINDSLPLLQIQLTRLKAPAVFTVHVTANGADIQFSLPVLMWTFFETPNEITIVIDSDTQEVYATQLSSGKIFNLNPYVIFSSLEFPILKPGENTISVQTTSGETQISKISITPRWWVL